MTTVAHKLYDTYREARLNFGNWYLCGVRDGKIDPVIVLLSGEALFQLSRCVNSQSNRFTMLIYEVPVRDVQVDVWCAMSASRIIELILESINSRQNVTV